MTQEFMNIFLERSLNDKLDQFLIVFEKTVKLFDAKIDYLQEQILLLDSQLKSPKLPQATNLIPPKVIPNQTGNRTAIMNELREILKKRRIRGEKNERRKNECNSFTR